MGDKPVLCHQNNGFDRGGIRAAAAEKEDTDSKYNLPFFRHSDSHIHLPSKSFEPTPANDTLADGEHRERKSGIEPSGFLVITLMVCQVAQIVSIDINDVEVVILVLEIFSF